MAGVFYQRTGYGFSVVIRSAEETGDEPFVLTAHTEDIERLVDSLTDDQEFIRILTELGVEPTPENITRIIEVVLCHDTRCKTRHYGIEHH